MPVRKDLTSGPLARTLFSLAAPIAVNSLLHALYATVDVFWLGRLGDSKAALAAPGAAGPFVFIATAFGMGFANAGTALVAQHMGAGRHRDADRAAAQTIMVLCALISVVALPGALLATLLAKASLVPEDALGPASAYLRLIMLGMPFVAFTIGYAGVLRALGDTLTVVAVTAMANVLNALLDPVLIAGMFGLPKMGVRGAGLATVLAQILAALACYVCLRRGRAGLTFTLRDMKPDWPIIRRAVGIGLPAAIGGGSNSLGFLGHTMMVNKMGVTVMGAVTVGGRFMEFFRFPADAMSIAAAPVVGQALGASKPRLARHAVWLSVRWVAGSTLLPFAFLIAFRHTAAEMFSKDPDIVAETGRFFLIVPASAYFFGVLMVLMAAFYGSGHTRPVMVLSLVRLWVLRLPLSYLFGFTLGMGSMGIYLGMAAANILSALMTLYAFWAGGWMSAVVPTAAKEPAAAGGSGGEMGRPRTGCQGLSAPPRRRRTAARRSASRRPGGWRTGRRPRRS
jgi:putative MATE family efflux protein